MPTRVAQPDTPGPGRDVHPPRHPDHQPAQRLTPPTGHGAVGAPERARSTVSAPAKPDRDPWRDAEGTPIPVGAVVEQTGIDVELGALRSRQGKRGQVLRRSATRLVVRFEGETTLARIRPHLVRVVDS